MSSEKSGDESLKGVLELDGLALIAAAFGWLFIHPSDLGVVGELGVALVLLAVGVVVYAKPEEILDRLAPESSMFDVTTERQTVLEEFENGE